MKRHLKKERELNDTPYGLRVLAIGTADQKLKKKPRKTDEHKRQKRVIYERDDVADSDTFFSEVPGLQKTADAEKKTVYTEKFAKKKNTKSSFVNNERNEDSHDLTTRKHPMKKFRRKMKSVSESRTTKTADKVDKSRHSSSMRLTSMPPVTQKSLYHKNCLDLEEESKFKSIWMGSDSDWTTLNIHLGMDPGESLKQAEKALEHYRTNLNDFWNIHGLTAGQGYGVDGQPWCTSHYSFHLVLWHIPLALSGQRYDAVHKRLTFDPKLKVPYALPFFTPFASGTVEAKKLHKRVQYKVTVTSGRLHVKLLAVSRSKLPKKKVNLLQGEYVCWERK